jgi:hypothetical protein
MLRDPAPQGMCAPRKIHIHRNFDELWMRRRPGAHSEALVVRQSISAQSPNHPHLFQRLP